MKKAKKYKLSASSTKTHQTAKAPSKAKAKRVAFFKNVAIFLSAFFVLYFFFILTFGGYSTSQTKTTFYALSSGTYSTEAEACVGADQIKLVGGGGNILEEDGEYQVLAFVYNSVDSATEVQTRLLADGLSLTVSVLEISTSGLGAEETQYVNSIIEVSNRVYDLMLKMPQLSSDTQTSIMLEEIQKTMVTATTRASLLCEDEQTLECIILTGTLITSGFSEVMGSQSITTQNLSWLRTQLLLYAVEFTQNC